MTKPPNGTIPSIVDATVFSELQDVLGDDLADLFAEFLEDAPVLINQINEALESGSTDALRHAAHTLKGSSGNLGINGLSSHCQALERAALEGRTAACPDHFRAVQEAFSATRQELSAWLQ